MVQFENRFFRQKNVRHFYFFLALPYIYWKNGSIFINLRFKL